MFFGDIVYCRLLIVQRHLALSQEFYTITVTDKNTWRFYLRFQVDHEFWEVARVVAEAKVHEGVRREQIDDLICGALDTVPTTGPAPSFTAVSSHPSASDTE